MGTRAMQKTSIFILFALAAAIWAVTEVQEIGNDDSTSGASVSLDADDSAEYDNIGEGTGVGRRAAFLSTSGSFTLSSGGGGGGNVGEEDELGEGVSVGRRAAFLSTSGSFTLSSGGGGGGNVGEEDDLGEGVGVGRRAAF